MTQVAIKLSRNEKLNSEWEGLLFSLLEHEKNLRDHGFNIITMINHLNRYEGNAKGDKKRISDYPWWVTRERSQRRKQQ